MIIGWGTANYLTCAPGDLPRHRYRIGLGVVIALALVLWMGGPVPPAESRRPVSWRSVHSSRTPRERQVSSTREQSIIADSETDQLGQQRAVILVAQAHPDTTQAPSIGSPICGHQVVQPDRTRSGSPGPGSSPVSGARTAPGRRARAQPRRWRPWRSNSPCGWTTLASCERLILLRPLP